MKSLAAINQAQNKDKIPWDSRVIHRVSLPVSVIKESQELIVYLFNQHNFASREVVPT
jgi:hypothetical protein